MGPEVLLPDRARRHAPAVGGAIVLMGRRPGPGSLCFVAPVLILGALASLVDPVVAQEEGECGVEQE